jgi:glycerol-3-phosphate acyltransferase PlsY
MLLVPLAILLASYLLGSIPFGYVAARVIRGIDIRQYGSGNIGATNVGRILGWPYFVLVFLLDFLKGAGPVWIVQSVIFPYLVPLGTALALDELATLAGLGAILGHMWPIYLRFRGGKGVATSAGVISVIAPVPTFVALAVWVVVLVSTRYVSVSSITAALALCVARFAAVWPHPFSAANRTVTLLCLIGATLVIVRHRSNLARLWLGVEPKLGQRHQAPPPAS